jgi:acetoin utilization protein AcuB
MRYCSARETMRGDAATSDEEVMSVSEIMSIAPVTVSMDDPLSKVKELFDRHRFHHLLVAEAGQLVGIVSDRDLLKALSPHIGKASETARDLASLNKRVHQIMTRKPIVLAATASIHEAIEIFNKHAISCIPIIDPENRPLGIVSWRDILKTLG